MFLPRKRCSSALSTESASKLAVASTGTKAASAGPVVGSVGSAAAAAGSAEAGSVAEAMEHSEDNTSP